MGRAQAPLTSLIGAALIFAHGPAAAAELTASIGWQGECDDRSSLHAELESRGVQLSEVPAGENVSSLSVLVQETPSKTLIADVLLTTPDAHEQRRVEARECDGLRRAVAWLLWALAEERRAEERQAAERSRQPSTAVFPAAPPRPADAPESPLPLRSISATRPSRERFGVATPTRREPCGYPAPRIGLGAELLLGLGMVETAALGPAIVGSYRPCTRWLPSFTLGASRLQTVGYEVAERSISIVRTSAQLGAWLDLAGPALRAGLAFEVGRIHASGSARGEARGLATNAPWLAFVAPVRLSVPVVARALTLEAGLAAAYTPQTFTLRYASGEALAHPGHFELRGSLGVSGHF